MPANPVRMLSASLPAVPSGARRTCVRPGTGGVVRVATAAIAALWLHLATAGTASAAAVVVTGPNLVILSARADTLGTPPLAPGRWRTLHLRTP
jgi:hypothetical protein